MVSFWALVVCVGWGSGVKVCNLIVKLTEEGRSHFTPADFGEPVLTWSFAKCNAVTCGYTR